MPVRRRLLLLGGVGLLVLAVLVAAGWRVLSGRLPFTDGSADQSRPGPVLLVPGYGGGEDALRILAGRLKAEGRQARIVEAIGDGTGDLSGQAAALDRAVRAEREAGAPSVDLVGFSAGGVVVRLWLNEYDVRRDVRRVVTLGSPHHGTEFAAGVAALAPTECTPACRQLVPGSELLDRLNDRDETPNGPRWVSIWTRDDTTVVPPQSARLEGAVNVELQQRCPTAGSVSHGDLPRNRAVTALTLQALGPGLAETPSAGECG